MFWKTVQKIPLKQLFIHPKRWSIMTRLVWIYTSSAFCILTVATFALYWIYTNRLESENYQFLENKIIALQNLIPNRATNQAILKEEIISEPILNHYYSRILDKNEKILLETPKMAEVIPINAFSHVLFNGDKKFHAAYLISNNKAYQKKHFLLMSASIGNNKDQIIQIAKDISAEHNIIEDYRQDLILILIFGVLASTMISILVTHKGLRPLREITKSTQRVSLEQLQERLNPDSLPKELARLAISFNEMLDRIEKGVNRLAQFSADLAHELRTPINNLMGEAEIALSKMRSKEEYKGVIESSVEEFERLSQMIESLLFLARAENPEASINLTTLPAQQVIEEVISFYEVAAEEKNIKMIYVKSAYQITADVLMLRRALCNLIYNALQHTASEGTITLSDQIINDAIHICIKDTGEGIAAEHLPYLFNRFYRTDKARSTKTGGTGLGLAIVKSIMDLHKGKVIIESEVNKGTCITLVFPKENIN